MIVLFAVKLTWSLVTIAILLSNTSGFKPNAEVLLQLGPGVEASGPSLKEGDLTIPIEP